MSEAPKDQEEAEIEPLSDESLEEVSGGICSYAVCSAGMYDNP
jgi:hypothetical protein